MLLTAQKDIYDEDPEIAKLVDFIVSDELLAIGDKVCLERLYKEILNKDWFMTLLDLKEYIKTKERVYKDYENKDAWNKKCLINIAKQASSPPTVPLHSTTRISGIWHKCRTCIQNAAADDSVRPRRRF